MFLIGEVFQLTLPEHISNGQLSHQRAVESLSLVHFRLEFTEMEIDKTITTNNNNITTTILMIH